MVSSQDSREAVERALAAGAADYLVKPLRANELRTLWMHVWRGGGGGGDGGSNSGCDSPQHGASPGQGSEETRM